jgi:hypothetical protein
VVNIDPVLQVLGRIGKVGSKKMSLSPFSHELNRGIDNYNISPERH